MKIKLGVLFILIVGIVLILPKDKGFEVTSRNPATSENKEYTSYYLTHVKPIFANRCVACHACAAAPCQLKLDSYEGVDRGALDVYPGALSVRDKDTTRIFKDAKTTEGWRKKGFWPVVNHDKGLSDSKVLEKSLLYQYVKHGKKRYESGALKEIAPRDKKSYKQCTKSTDQFHNDLKLDENQDIGMPFGTAALTDKEFSIIENWILMGAPGPSEADEKILKSATNRNTINKWESFLNTNTNKHAWSSKYIYEHLYLAHFHFEDNPGEFFELQRVRPGTTDEVVTHYPFDDPKTKISYHFKKIHSTIAHKTHIVFEVNDKSLVRVKELFINAPWKNKVVTPVNYKEINPFHSFIQIPAKSRYRFLIENSRLFLDFFARGPVCSGGSMPTWVIQDHSWLFFEHPDYDVSVTNPNYFDKVKKVIVIPTAHKQKRLWPFFISRTKAYERKHAKFLAKTYPKGRSLKHVWDGDTDNPNAMLTIYRHKGYSVNVLQGQVGELPKTYGLVNYSILERVFYDLVAGFNVGDNLNIKLNLRLMITQLRREMEDNYLSLLPKEMRKPERKKWYKDYKSYSKPYHFNKLDSQVLIKDPTVASKELALQIINNQLNLKTAGPADRINGHKRLNTSLKTTSKVNDLSSLNKNLSFIGGLKTGFARFFPEISYFRFKDPNGKYYYYSAIKNRAFTSIHYLTGEDRLFDPENSSLNIVKDFYISFPLQFFDVNFKDAQDFIKEIHQIKTITAYQELENRYGIKKGDSNFWDYYDHLNEHIKRVDPVNAGIIDLNRYGIHHFPEYKF